MFNISFQLGVFVHARTFLWSRRSEKPRFFAASRIPRVSRTWQNTPWRLWQWLTSPQSHLDGKRKGLSEELFFSSKDAMNPWICKTLLGEMSNAHFLKRVWVKGIMFVFELDFKWWFCFQRNVSKPLVLYRLFVTLHLSAAIILLLKPLVIRPDINVPIHCWAPEMRPSLSQGEVEVILNRAGIKDWVEAEGCPTSAYMKRWLFIGWR